MVRQAKVSDSACARWIVRLPIAGAGVVAAAALAGGPFYVVDLAASLCGPALAIALIIAAWCLARRRWWDLGAAAAVAATLAGLQASTLPRAARLNPSTPGLRILIANTRASSADAAAAQLAALTAADADIIALIEPSAELLDAVRRSEPFRERWPHAHLPDRAAGGFIVAFLRHEPDGVELNGRVVRLAEPFPCTLVLAHPRSPRSLATWRSGNAEVEGIVGRAGGRGGVPVIVAGDLNSTGTGRRGRRLASAGLRAGKPLVEPSGTWPAWSAWPLTIAIDDVWVTPELGIASWATRPMPGSDHLAVIAVIAPAGG